jgi:hypothetical protein
VTSADDEMSAADRILMRALSEAIGGTPPPVDLVSRSEGLLAWIDVDSELAALLDQPVAEAAGTRGATAPATLEFVVGDGSCVIELTPSDNAIRGQLLGGEAHEIVVRTAAGDTHSFPIDEMGNFTLDQPTSGTIRLELELIPESRRIHTDWFVV